MLHITNGDAARAVLTLRELSTERAAFIAEASSGAFDELLASFRSHDECLARAGAEDEVDLWFEHPAPLLDILSTDLAALPFVRTALIRHLQEFPWVGDGLSAWQIGGAPGSDASSAGWAACCCSGLRAGAGARPRSR